MTEEKNTMTEEEYAKAVKEWKDSIYANGLNEYDYLVGVTLRLTTFSGKDRNSHEHCVFCWKTFSNYDCDLQSGYATLDKYYWICPECFADFKELFKWNLVDDVSDN